MQPTQGTGLEISFCSVEYCVCRRVSTALRMDKMNCLEMVLVTERQKG